MTKTKSLILLLVRKRVLGQRVMAGGWGEMVNKATKAGRGIGSRSLRRSCSLAQVMVVLCASVLGVLSVPRTAVAQCRNDGVPCSGDVFQPIGVPGCVAGCANPYPGGNGTGMSADGHYQGPQADSPSRTLGAAYGNSQHMTHAQVITPTVRNPAHAAVADPNAHNPTVGAVALHHAIPTEQGGFSNPMVPRPTVKVAPAAYPGDPAKPPVDEPIDHNTGEFVLTHVDMQFPGFGVPFVLTRTYGSRREFNGPLGAATDHSYNLRLVPSPEENCAGHLLYMTGAGSTIEFEPGPLANGVQTFAAPDGVRLALKGMYAGGSLIGYWMTRPDGLTATFDRRGFIITLLDLNDRGLHFGWDLDHERLDLVHDSAGRDIAFSYDDANRVTQVLEKTTGLHADYVYDDATGELLQATDASGQAEVYEYQHTAAVPSDEYIPESFLVDACELSCAPSATSCHAGDACAAYDLAATSACRSGCASCLPDCVHSCDTQCEAGRDTCRNGDGTAAHPGCESGCSANCPTLDQAVEKCRTLWDTPMLTIDPLTDSVLASPHERCQALEDDPANYAVACDPVFAPAQCLTAAGGASACAHGKVADAVVFYHANCGCYWYGNEGACHGGFMGDQIGTCGCDMSDPQHPVCPDRQARGGCPVQVRNECKRLCNDSCEDDCVDSCKSDCVLTSCLPSCDVPSCDADCDATNFGAECNDSCVADCVQASHAYTGSRTEGPRFPEGPKYGYGSDLNHNLFRIYNADGRMRLENTFGQNIAEPSFDAVISQRTGEQTIDFGYRDYATELGLVTVTPNHDPSTDLVATTPPSTSLTATAPGFNETASHELAAQYTVPFDSFETAQLCPGRCERTPTPGPLAEYVPTPDGLVAVTPWPGSTMPGGLSSLAMIGGGGVPATVFQVHPGGGGNILTTMPAYGGLPVAGTWPISPGLQVFLRRAETPGGATLTLVRGSDNSLTLSGTPAVLDLLRAAGEISVLTDTRGYLHVYPGRPRSFVYLATGSCSDVFRAELNAVGQLQMTGGPLGLGCSGDLSVVPMASLVTDPGARSRFLSSGSGGLTQDDLFVPTALLNGRWTQRWRSTASGRYELSIGADEGAAPNTLTSKISTAAGRSRLLVPITSADNSARPFYVFHLPQPLRPTSNTSAYAWDKPGAFDARETRTDCVASVIDAPERGHGLSASGPLPAHASVVLDAYGIAWTFYYDGQGRQIRVVNQGTHAQHSFNYNASHELAAMEDPTGIRQCFAYDANGDVVAQTTLPAPFNVAGDVAPIRRLYEYQSSPVRISKVFDPRDPTRILSSFTWDDKGNLRTETDAGGIVKTFTPSEFGPPAVAVGPNGGRITMAWDASTATRTTMTIGADEESPVTSVTHHDKAGHPIDSTGPLGDGWVWQWNGAVLETATHNADGKQEVVHYTYDDNKWPYQETDGRYQITTHRDVLGNPVRQEALAIDGTAAPAVTCRHVGFDGRLIEEVRPEGLRVKPQYDGEGRLISVTAGFLPQDSLATWDDGCTVPVAGPEVDAADIGRSYEMGHVTYDGAGRIQIQRDPFGAETRYQYDGYGRPIISTDASQHTVRVGYDALDRLAWRAGYDGAGSTLPYQYPSLGDTGLLAMTEYHYDEAGRLTSEDAWHFDRNHVPIGDGHAITRYAYDPSVNSVAVTDDSGASTTYFYDDAGRHVSTLLPTQDRVDVIYKQGGRWIAMRVPAPTPNGYVERATLLNQRGLPAELYMGDGLGHTSKVRTIEYDSRGEPIKSTGLLGVESEALYDAFGRPSTTTNRFDDATRERVTYFYNRDGRTLAQTSDIGTTLATTRNHYDSLGRVRVTERPDRSQISNTYIAGSSHVLTATDAASNLWIFDYHANGQSAGIAATPGLHSTNGNARRFSYDGMGRLIEATDKGTDYASAADDITTTFQWDSLSNKTAEWDTNTGATSATSAIYDGRGLPTQSTYGPYTIMRTYDSLGREDTIQASSTTLARFAYRGVGGPISRTLGSGVVSTYAYDVMGRLEGITDAKNSLPVASWRYEMPLDGIPRLAGFRKAGASEVASIFKVDQAGRLLGEEHGLSALDSVQLDPQTVPTEANLTSIPGIGRGTDWRTYTLDGRSNWTGRQAADPNLRTSPSINAIDGYEAFGGQVSTFDAAGRLQTFGDESYSVDYFGQLTDATKGTQHRQFTYDALGRLVREKDAQTGAVTKYAFDGMRRAGQLNADGSWVLPVDGSGLDEHVALVSSSGPTRYLHQDRSRSVYLVTDDQGAPVEWYRYSAFGEIKLSDALGNPLTASTVGNRFGFQGQPYYAGLGLVDMRSRFYRPSWGRFIATDLVGLAGGPNLYAFVGSAPLAWWDPMGFGSQAVDAGIPSEPIAGTWGDPQPPLNYQGEMAFFYAAGDVAGAVGDTLAGSVNGALGGLVFDEVPFGHKDFFYGGQFATSAIMLGIDRAAQAGGGALVVVGGGCIAVSGGACVLPGGAAVAMGGAAVAAGTFLAPFHGNALQESLDEIGKAAPEEGAGSGGEPPAAEPAPVEPAAPKPANATRTGLKRTNAADWRRTRDVWDELGEGDILSADNRQLIANGSPPVVDETWVAHFPEDAGLMNEQIRIHHIGGTRINVPLPESRHLDAHMPGGFRYNPGGPGSWAPAYPAIEDPVPIDAEIPE